MENIAVRRIFLTTAILALACLVQRPALAQEAGPRPMGVGGFPVSFMHASAWLTHRTDSTGKELTLMVYLQGAPGWHDHVSDFKSEFLKNPATIDMSLDNTPINISYWPETSEVEILGNKFSLLQGNVFLVKDIDGINPTAESLGTHDLSFASKDNPAIVLLQRNEELRAALIGRPAINSSSKPKTNVPDELIAWDSEALRLFNSNRAEDDKKACELLRRAATEDYANSQYGLGYCYESGRGVEKDPSVANQWYEKAANQGHVDAQYKLGHSYRVGRGVEIDLVTALSWYKKAAENNDLDAIHNVGWMYATGQGVEANAREAFTWYLKAANGGSASSQHQVARHLHDGDGTEKDLFNSYVWLLALKAQKKTFTPTYWAEVHELMQSVESKLNETEKIDAEEKSQQLLRVLAKLYIENLGK